MNRHTLALIFATTFGGAIATLLYCFAMSLHRDGAYMAIGVGALIAIMVFASINLDEPDPEPPSGRKHLPAAAFFMQYFMHVQAQHA